MSDKQESIVIVKESQRLYDAIQAFRAEAESIEFQRLYGDEARPPLKMEFDAANAVIEDHLQRILKTLWELNARLAAALERIEIALVERDCACSSCGCGGWGEFVYENADSEDGVKADVPAKTREVTGLAGDECNCDRCREVPYL